LVIGCGHCNRMRRLHRLGHGNTAENQELTKKIGEGPKGRWEIELQGQGLDGTKETEKMGASKASYRLQRFYAAGKMA